MSITFDKGANVSDMSFKDLSFNNGFSGGPSFPIFKSLIEHGLDANAIVLLQSGRGMESLEFMQSQGIELTPHTLLSYLVMTRENPKILDFFIKNSTFDINQKFQIDGILNQLAALGPKFKEHIDDMSTDITKALSYILANNDNLPHLAVEHNKPILALALLNRADIDVNALNDKGQTLLSFATSAEIIKMLIDHHADLSINVSDKIIREMLIENDIEGCINLIYNNNLPHNYREEILYNQFHKKNFEYARKIYDTKIELKNEKIELKNDFTTEFVKAIEAAISNAVEPNKYHALVNLMWKAGINMPDNIASLRYTVKDDNFKKQDISDVHNLLHSLANAYLDMSQKQLQEKVKQDCQQSQELLTSIATAFQDSANSFIHFEKAKELCPQSKALSVIDDSFDALYQTLGKALTLLDNDFAVQILTINGMPPPPLKEEIIVFRGMGGNLDDNDINALFKYGTRAFSKDNNDNYQKFLSYYVATEWNGSNSKAWQLGGTYVSLSQAVSAKYSKPYTSSEERVLIEMSLPKGSPLICGLENYNIELVPSTIEGNDIVAIYKLTKDGTIYHAVKNPYLQDGIEPSYSDGDFIGFERLGTVLYNLLYYSFYNEDSIQTQYNSLCPNKLLDKLFYDYEDFLTQYNESHHISDQQLVDEWYFTDRFSSTEPVTSEALISDSAV